MQEGTGGEGYSRKVTLLFLIHCIEPAFCSNHFSLHPKKLSFACTWAKKGKMSIAFAEFFDCRIYFVWSFLVHYCWIRQSRERETRRNGERNWTTFLCQDGGGA